MTPRDASIMGLQSQLLGAHADGVRNILAVTGDPPHVGDYPGSSGVYFLALNRSDDTQPAATITPSTPTAEPSTEEAERAADDWEPERSTQHIANQRSRQRHRPKPPAVRRSTSAAVSV